MTYYFYVRLSNERPAFGYFLGLVSQYVFDIQVAPDHESRQELMNLLGDVASCSDHLSCSVADGEGLQFTIVKDGMPTGIRFRAVPNGHEFTSLLLAVLNSDGKGKIYRTKVSVLVSEP